MTNETNEPTISAMYPRLVVAGAARAIDFYRAALGATETARHTDDGGKVVHAELRVGDIVIAVKDEGGGDPAPSTLGGSPVILALTVDDAGAIGERMVQAGAAVVHPIQDWEYGSRGGRLADPFGHLWMIDQPLRGS